MLPHTTPTADVDAAPGPPSPIHTPAATIPPPRCSSTFAWRPLLPPHTCHPQGRQTLDRPPTMPLCLIPGWGQRTMDRIVCQHIAILTPATCLRYTFHYCRTRLPPLCLLPTFPPPLAPQACLPLSPGDTTYQFGVRQPPVLLLPADTTSASVVAPVPSAPCLACLPANIYPQPFWRELPLLPRCSASQRYGTWCYPTQWTLFCYHRHILPARSNTYLHNLLFLRLASCPVYMCSSAHLLSCRHLPPACRTATAQF